MKQAAPEPKAAWDLVLEILRKRLNRQAVETWLRPTREIGLEAGRLRVQVPSAHFADWITRSYGDEIDRALVSIGLKGIALDLVYFPEPPARGPAVAPIVRSSGSPAPTRSSVAAAYRQHPITMRVAIGLIDPKHRRSMGGAVWTYLWCLKHQTGPDGLIYAGRPVTVAEIAASLAFTPRHTSRQLDRLVQRKYVTVERRPEGLVLRVNWQKKFPPRESAAGAGSR
jgi:DnaA-like protein